jgi:hypothetical protein
LQTEARPKRGKAKKGGRATDRETESEKAKTARRARRPVILEEELDDLEEEP